MKRIFISLITILLVAVLCLNSCDISEITSNFDVYQVTVTGETEYLGQPVLPFYKAGDIVEIKVPKICDAEISVYVNDVKLSGVEYDIDYNLFKFEMPSEDVTVHLTFDSFYGRTDFSFGELLYWVKNLETGIGGVPINGVSLTINNFADETSFIEKRYSEKQEDIDNFKAITNQPLVKADYSDLGDVDNYFTYSFYCNDNPYTGDWVGDLEFEDSFFSFLYNLTSYPQPFRFEDADYALPTIENPDYITYSFRREPRIIYVEKYNDDSFSERYDYMTYVEFVPYEGPTLDIEPEFYFDTKCGRVNLLNSTVFELNGEYYEIVSGESSWAYSKLNLKVK